MSEQIPVSPLPLVPPVPPAPPRNDQDRKIADRISDTREKLLIAKSDPEILAPLTSRGYTGKRLDDEGFALQAEAQNAYNLRQTAMGVEDHANQTFAAAFAARRQSYVDFRTTGRRIFKKDPAAQAGLKLTGRISSDAQQFVTDARASYNAGLSTPAYLAELAREGYDQAALTRLLAELDALQDANTAQEAARAAATRATQQRDAADAALSDWMGRFRTAAGIALRDRPDLLRKLGL